MLHHQRRQSPPSSAAADDEPKPAPVAAEPEPVDIFLTHVPANLRAKFGKAHCRALLADQDEVQQAWNRLLADGSPLASTRSPPQRLPPLHDDRRQKQFQQEQQQKQSIDWYSALSEQFNSDYSPGVTNTRRLGHNRETHGGAVFGPEAGAYNEDNWRRPHRLRKDEFSAYNEIVHVERKFNNQWQTEQQAAAAAPTMKPVQRQPPPHPPSVVKSQQQQQQPLQPSASILSNNSSDKAHVAKHVTIEDQAGPGDKLQRANTVQRSEQ
ncbi:hypothetical protein BOX15_Mlig012454g1 [Macrostomum lignano]|uniref:Uncharacterized protein n=1 Tax=Macrostomum lignano TaxID=282301 RepID=A0A267GJR1_9PLAT|nr:hypothetical protein BOX15_Mlig012454g1 [Macrostomum lignano]